MEEKRKLVLNNTSIWTANTSKKTDFPARPTKFTLLNEPGHDKTNKMAVHPVKNQIRHFAVCSMGS